jgi:hypothetical protein
MEQVEADGYSVVGLVGNQLGEGCRRNHECDEGEKYFFHIE